MASLSRLLLPLILLSTGILMAQDAFPTASSAKQDAAAYLKPLNKRGVVRYQVIAGDFSTNQIAAIGKYSDKRITVIGRIAHLGNPESENKVLTVTLQNASASLPAVKGEFLSGSLPLHSAIDISQDGSTATLVKRDAKGKILSQNTFLTVDQTIAIKGNYKELKAGDIVLTNCKLIPKERLHELRHDLIKTQN